MGIFSFLKKSKPPEPDQYSPIIGMVLLEEPNTLEMEKVVRELKIKWKLRLTNQEGNDKAFILEIKGYRIAIADMDVPIPTEEVVSVAGYNYLWENATTEVSKHKGHIIISIVNAGKNPVKENLLYSKIISAVLNNSQSIGIYIGDRTLVLQKEFYLANTEVMSKNSLPLFLWIYFGLREESGKRSIYTHGLANFGKKEMEILDSVQESEEVSEMMYNLTHYVVAYDVQLKDGETVGTTIDQKLKVSESKGKFLEGNTLKINF